jgi:hypothetical protein
LDYANYVKVMGLSVLARRGLLRRILGSGRTAAWDQAVHDYHAKHKTCEMCGLPAGTLRTPTVNLDGQPGSQEQLEAHDVQPYHTLTPKQQNDYRFIYGNLIMLHHFEHHHIAHCGDPECLRFNPQIRVIADWVMKAQVSCTS